MSDRDEAAWKKLLGCLLLPLILPVLIIVIPILNVLGLNKMSAKPEYLIEYLEMFIAGTEGAWDLDDFCSIPLKDERLEAIRVRACDAFQFVDGEMTIDRDRLAQLLEEARSLAEKQG